MQAQGKKKVSTSSSSGGINKEEKQPKTSNQDFKSHEYSEIQEIKSDDEEENERYPKSSNMSHRLDDSHLNITKSEGPGTFLTDAPSGIKKKIGEDSLNQSINITGINILQDVDKPMVTFDVKLIEEALALQDFLTPEARSKLVQNPLKYDIFFIGIDTKSHHTRQALNSNDLKIEDIKLLPFEHFSKQDLPLHLNVLNYLCYLSSKYKLLRKLHREIDRVKSLEIDILQKYEIWLPEKKAVYDSLLSDNRSTFINSSLGEQGPLKQLPVRTNMSSSMLSLTLEEKLQKGDEKFEKLNEKMQMHLQKIKTNIESRDLVVATYNDKIEKINQRQEQTILKNKEKLQKELDKTNAVRDKNTYDEKMRLERRQRKEKEMNENSILLEEREKQRKEEIMSKLFEREKKFSEHRQKIEKAKDIQEKVNSLLIRDSLNYLEKKMVQVEENRQKHLNDHVNKIEARLKKVNINRERALKLREDDETKVIEEVFENLNFKMTKAEKKRSILSKDIVENKKSEEMKVKQVQSLNFNYLRDKQEDKKQKKAKTLEDVMKSHERQRKRLLSERKKNLEHESLSKFERNLLIYKEEIMKKERKRIKHIEKEKKKQETIKTMKRLSEMLVDNMYLLTQKNIQERDKLLEGLKV